MLAFQYDPTIDYGEGLKSKMVIRRRLHCGALEFKDTF